VWINEECFRKVVRCIREYAPDLIITHRPNDYHRDHRYVGQLVMDASYMLLVPLAFPEYPTPYRKMPVIAYAYDNFENPLFKPSVILDITDVYEKKALGCMQHTSQLLEWLPYSMEMDNVVPEDYDFNKRRELVETLIQFSFSSAMSDFRKLIKAGYPDRKVRQVEAFEICPYGRQPSLKELKELFPDGIYPSKANLEEVTSDIPELKKQIADLKKELKEIKAKVLPEDKKVPKETPKDSDKKTTSEVKKE
jgi:hypothetical protein